MSSDTSIAIGKFPDGWRCTEVVQAVENLNSQYYDTKLERQDMVRCYFFGSKVYKTKAGAMRKAIRVQTKYETDDDWGMGLEYGIVDAGEFNFTISGIGRQ